MIITRRKAIISGAAALAEYRLLAQGIGGAGGVGGKGGFGGTKIPAFNVVQTFTTNGTPGSFASPNTSGNTIVIWYSVFFATAPAVSDSNGNTYVHLANLDNDTVAPASNSGFFVATGIAGGANTVSYTGGGSRGNIIVAELPHISSIEASTPIAATSGTSLATGTITTTAVNDVILMGGYGDIISGPFSLGNSNSWATVNSATSSVNTGAMFIFLASGAGGYSNTLTSAGSQVLQTGMIGLKR